MVKDDFVAVGITVPHPQGSLGERPADEADARHDDGVRLGARAPEPIPPGATGRVRVVRDDVTGQREAECLKEGT